MNIKLNTSLGKSKKHSTPVKINTEKPRLRLRGEHSLPGSVPPLTPFTDADCQIRITEKDHTSDGPTSNFKTDKAKLNHLTKRLLEINEWSFGPVGSAVHHLLEEVGIKTKYVNNSTKRTRSSK